MRRYVVTYRTSSGRTGSMEVVARSSLDALDIVMTAIGDACRIEVKQ